MNRDALLPNAAELRNIIPHPLPKPLLSLPIPKLSQLRNKTSNRPKKTDSSHPNFPPPNRTMTNYAAPTTNSRNNLLPFVRNSQILVKKMLNSKPTWRPSTLSTILPSNFRPPANHSPCPTTAPSLEFNLPLFVSVITCFLHSFQPDPVPCFFCNTILALSLIHI